MESLVSLCINPNKATKILLGIHGLPSYLLSADTTLVMFVAYADYGKNPFSFVGFMQSSYLSSAGTTLWS